MAAPMTPAKIAARQARRAAKAKARADAKAAIDAERARQREAARLERARQVAAHADECDRIAALAPADEVRAWARRQGLPIGNRGRISLDLRKKYLTAHHQDGAA